MKIDDFAQLLIQKIKHQNIFEEIIYVKNQQQLTAGSLAINLGGLFEDYLKLTLEDKEAYRMAK